MDIGRPHPIDARDILSVAAAFESSAALNREQATRLRAEADALERDALVCLDCRARLIECLDTVAARATGR